MSHPTTSARIDSSFATSQRDLFESGLAAEIGMNSFGVWTAIKHHSDYETGRAWPGMRRLAELTGLNKDTVNGCVRSLIEHKLLRVVEAGGPRKSNTYIARERLDVRLGDRILCTLVMDYVPARLRGQIRDIEDGLRKGKASEEVFAHVEIIPGPGFAWDPKANVLRAAIPARELPAPADDATAKRALDYIKTLLPPGRRLPVGKSR